jgi:hypothetical protein
MPTREKQVSGISQCTDRYLAAHKLVDAEMVLNIRSRFDGKWGGLTKLSRQLGLKYSTVHAIVTRRSWAHV